ncbi:chemotaxis protein CheW [Fluviispira vulneris]|uniref:chemotaxis protein CheW n=1 Tax=Fluviispira vulneris TaxID=2763012 RepID=UPI0016442972|nr:chemotaxis protein CheW [Fluviispira vulneris]
MSAKSQKCASEGRYLSFQLGQEIFALEIKCVSEIIGMDKITELPDTEKYVKGVINLRGHIIPIMDLRLKLHLIETEYSKQTCIIIVDTGTNKVGIIVDSVQDVLDFTNKQIDITPEICSVSNLGIVTGIGKVQEKNVILVDMFAILASAKINFEKLRV